MMDLCSWAFTVVSSRSRSSKTLPTQSHPLLWKVAQLCELPDMGEIRTQKSGGEILSEAEYPEPQELGVVGSDSGCKGLWL